MMPPNIQYTLLISVRRFVKVNASVSVQKFSKTEYLYVDRGNVIWVAVRGPKLA